MLRRAVVFAFFALTLLLFSQSLIPQKAAAASNFYVASLNADIDAGTQDFVTSSIGDARSSGANTFVLVLNTFGGNGNNMDNIIQAISNYETAGNIFITLVAPAQTHAFSAGAFIAEASDKIYMVNQTVIGSATPVLPPLSDPTELRKDIAGFSEYMKAITEGFGRNGTAAAQMVTNGTSYTNTEATNLHVVDGTLTGTSLSLRDALAALPSPYTVPDAQNIQIHEAGIRATTISVLSDPNLDSVLFLLGVFAILIDLFHPTLILSAIGATALALALVGLGVFGASLISIVLMLIGALFIFLEIKIHHGLSAVIGVVIFIIGFILIFRLPPSPPVANQPTGSFVPVGAITYAILGFIGGGVVLGSLYLYRVRETLMHRPPTINPKAIIGKEGRLNTDLKTGELATALIGAEEWTVTSSQDMPKGTIVIVKDLNGLRLVVERKDG